jgi:GntP family gluconate:H+ symporter
MLYGGMVAIPTAILAGPIFARYASPHVKATRPIFDVEPSATPPPIAAALIVVLLPVALISANAAVGALGRLGDGHLGWMIELGNPIAALVITIGVALVILFPPEAKTAQTRASIWREAMTPAGSVLLSIGAGGALKQVLIAAGLSRVLSHLASGGFVLLLGFATSGSMVAQHSSMVVRRECGRVPFFTAIANVTGTTRRATA